MSDISASTIAIAADFARAAYHLIDEATGEDLNVVSAGADLVYGDLLDDWSMLEAADLDGIGTRTTDDDDFRTGLEGGIFTRNNAAALLAVEGDTLVLSFRGTNDDPDPQDDWWDVIGTLLPGLADLFYSPDVGDWVGKDEHWDQFDILMDALEDYVSDEENGIENVPVTGHSLGAAMGTKFMDTYEDGDWGGAEFEAVFFGNPGYSFLDDTDDERVVNLLVDGESVDLLTQASGILDSLTGSLTRFFGRFSGETVNDGSDKHGMALYQSFAHLMEEHGLDLSDLERNWDGIHAGIEAEDIDLNSFLAGLERDVLRSEDTSENLRDLLLGGRAKDTLTGGRGEDWLFGGRGHDKLFAGRGDDRLEGGTGHDKLYGDEGNDILFGGLGDDRYFFGLNDGIDRVTELLDQGRDLIRAEINAFETSFDLRLDGDDLTIRYDDQTLLTAHIGEEELRIEAFRANDGPTREFNFGSLKEKAANVILGSDAAERLKAGGGKDILSGGLGDDDLLGGRGWDIYLFAEGDGQDRIVDASGQDVIQLFGQLQDDIQFSRDGDDLLIEYGETDLLTLAGQFVEDKQVIETLILQDTSLEIATDLFLDLFH
ncbi:MAG: hypothetical protein Alpg2KO_18760 [Alphaproteobacteria bacterium]